MTDLTNEDRAEAMAHVTSVYNARKAAIEATVTHIGNCVLMFEDGIRFVCGSTVDPTISGFEHSLKFGDRQAAIDFLKRTRLRDGNQEEPRIVSAFNAKQHALIELERHLGALVNKDQASA